ATIFTAGDIDYYKIHADTQGMLTVNMANIPSNIIPVISIYDSAYNPLLDQVVGSPGQDLILNSELPNSGDYYLQVSDASGNSSSTSPYNLRTTFISAADAYEPNNDFEHAASINIGDSIQATIFNTGDLDYYKIHTDTQGMLTVNMTNVPSNIIPVISIYDSAYNPLLDLVVGSPGQDLIFNSELPGSGDYYLQVYDASGSSSSTSPYNLRATFISAADAYEPNNDFEHASSIQIGDSIQATIFTAGDIDYYKIHADTQGMLTVNMANVPANIIPVISIYDSTYNPLLDLVGSPDQDLILNSELPGSGDYYLQVSDASSGRSSTSSYSLKVTLSDVWVRSFSDSPDHFSPNSDNINDTNTITAEFSKEVSWTVTIKDSQANTIITFTGTGSSLSQIWDGKDSGDVLVGDGIYTYQIDAQAHGSIAPSVTGMITLDNTPPNVSISSPFYDATVSGEVTIKGSANDEYLASYQLEYGQGESPESWAWTIIPQLWESEPVNDDTLGIWNTKNLVNGTYSLRLSAEDKAGNISTTKICVTLDNIKIDNVSINPSSFNPSNNETVTISYAIDRDAAITIRIYDLDNNLIRTLINSASRSQGQNSEIWDGRNNLANIVQEGGYTITIEAHTGVSESYYQSSGGYNGNYVSDFTVTPNFNPYNNELCEIRFTLLENSLFSLGIGQHENYSSEQWVMFNKLLPAGSHVYYWDGRDRNGRILDYCTLNFPLIVAYYSYNLPENTIMVISPKIPEVSVYSDAYAIIPSYGETVNISYTIPVEGNVTITILKPAAVFIKKLIDNQPHAAGTYTVSWDGRDADGKLVSDADDYIIRVELNANGSSTVRNGNISIDVIKRNKTDPW
ncbi:MAG: FlgD immunoglobulin-like domain containing protein, partial [Planctomycetota bacterium]